MLSAKNEKAIADAVADITGASERLTDILTAVRGEGDEDQEKASGQSEVKDEEPELVKSEDVAVNPSVEALAMKTRFLALKGAN